MRSAPADLLRQAGRPLVWAAGLVVFALVAVTLVVLLTRPQQAVLPTSEASTSQSSAGSSDTRGYEAAALLERLTTLLESGRRSQVEALADPADPSARQELGTIFDNVRAAGVTDLSMRYVDEDTGALTSDGQSPGGADEWVGDVSLTWRLRGFDLSDSTMNVTLTFAQEAHAAGFVTAVGDYGDAVPLWLLEPVAVERNASSMVMVADQSEVKKYATLAAHAVSDVRKVLPDWRGKLVVEVPQAGADLSRLLNADPSTYANIAAVTTPVDGSSSSSAPTHIFVNPSVFDKLGPEGSQIVISHEATHVATHAATSSMPMWLIEGFADYVALDHVNLPVTVTASQILGQVRKQGVPSHLPGPTEFNTENKALGSSYEAAWLACRLLSQKYGEQKLIEFYRQSDRDSSTDRAFRVVLGTTQQAFTRDWQQYLLRLAH